MTIPPPDPATRRGRPLKQILILLGGGAILAFGGCAMFLGSNNPSARLPMVWAAAFVVGLLMIVAGFGYGLVLIIKSLMRKNY